MRSSYYKPVRCLDLLNLYTDYRFYQIHRKPFRIHGSDKRQNSSNAGVTTPKRLRKCAAPPQELPQISVCVGILRHIDRVCRGHFIYIKRTFQQNITLFANKCLELVDLNKFYSTSVPLCAGAAVWTTQCFPEMWVQYRSAVWMCSCRVHVNVNMCMCLLHLLAVAKNWPVSECNNKTHFHFGSISVACKRMSCHLFRRFQQNNISREGEMPGSGASVCKTAVHTQA